MIAHDAPRGVGPPRQAALLASSHADRGECFAGPAGPLGWSAGVYEASARGRRLRPGPKAELAGDASRWDGGPVCGRIVRMAPDARWQGSWRRCFALDATASSWCDCEDIGEILGEGEGRPAWPTRKVQQPAGAAQGRPRH